MLHLLQHKPALAPGLDVLSLAVHPPRFLRVVPKLHLVCRQELWAGTLEGVVGMAEEAIKQAALLRWQWEIAAGDLARRAVHTACFLLFFSNALREFAATRPAPSGPCPLCSISAILRGTTGQQGEPHGTKGGVRAEDECGGWAYSLHAGAGERVEHRADGGLVTLQRQRLILHIRLQGSLDTVEPPARRAGGAPGHNRQGRRLTISAVLTGLRVNKTRLLPRMDQRLMWCSGYLRRARLPAASRMLNPSSPTSTTTRSWPPSSASSRT